MKRFQSLIGNNTRALADYLGCTIQAVNQYKAGTAYPKTENLIKIAKFFGVSMDYLLGLSDVQSTDATIQNVCHFTGLTEKAVMSLAKMKHSGDFQSLRMIGKVIALYDEQGED